MKNGQQGMPIKIVVAVTGASGSIYAKLLIEKLLAISDQWTDVAIVMSENAKTVWQFELGEDIHLPENIKSWDIKDFNAPFASGSAGYNVMFVVPCSMGTMARIANGISADLITRAADVMLKESGKLVMVPRETPYNLIHVKNMKKVIQAGGIVCPASPSFYSQPKSIAELAATVVDRVLHLAGFHIDSYRWGH